MGGKAKGVKLGLINTLFLHPNFPIRIPLLKGAFK